MKYVFIASSGDTNIASDSNGSESEVFQSPKPAKSPLSTAKANTEMTVLHNFRIDKRDLWVL